MMPENTTGDANGQLSCVASAAIRAAKPGGVTRGYFEKERGWEAPMRQRFAGITGAIAADRARAQADSIDLLKEMGRQYWAIWPDTRITYPIFYDCMFQAIDRRGWWTGPPPGLFGCDDGEAGEIAGVVRDTLALCAGRGEHRHYSLLTKWLHFCFADTFAIYDSQAAKSIQAARLLISPRTGTLSTGLDQFLAEQVSNTRGSGYVGLLNFYRLVWDDARAARLDRELLVVADEIQAILRREPGCPDAKVSALDILDKLLWKANGSGVAMGITQG